MHQPGIDRICALFKQSTDKLRSLCNLSFHLVHLPNQLYINAFWKPCCKSLIRRDFLWTTWPHWQHRFEQKSSRTFPENNCAALHQAEVWKITPLLGVDIWIINSQSKHTRNMHLIWSWKFDVWQKTKEKIFNLGNMFHLHFIAGVLETFAEVPSVTCVTLKRRRVCICCLVLHACVPSALDNYITLNNERSGTSQG